MSRDWKPGDVALVECSDGKERRALCGRRALDYGLAWVFRDGSRRDVEESNARPLVAIDPEDMPQVERLVAAFWANGTDDFDDPTAMQSALRSLAAPPKPEEPTDPAARVKTSNGVEWAKVGPWWVCAWLSEVPRDWDYLVDLGVIL